MSLDFVNQHVAKILVAVEDGDSINHISRKTGSSYSYTYEWIQRLEESGVVRRDDGVHVKDEAFVAAFESIVRTVYDRELELDDAYLLPNFAGMEYRFSKTDAVFIWTRGGYQIGRNRDDYPIFVDVLEDDLDEWQRFFASYGVETSVKDRTDAGGIYYVLFPRSEEFRAEWVENSRVTPLLETVGWAREYEANFQPALEMLDEQYDLDLGVEYRERSVMSE